MNRLIAERSAAVAKEGMNERVAKALWDRRTVTYNWPCHIGVSFNCDC